MAAASTPHPQTLTVHVTNIDVEYAEDQGNTKMTLTPHGQGLTLKQLRNAFQGWCRQDAATSNTQIRASAGQVIGTFIDTPAERLQQQQSKLQTYLEQNLRPQGKATATSGTGHSA